MIRRRLPGRGQTEVRVRLEEASTRMNAVVVTAMGIKRQSKTLTYAAETVGGEDVADIKSINMINSLQGKSAGLQITPNSTGAGGSSKILFRGNKSISGSNQPLVVVDGVPLMMNTSTDQVASSIGNGTRDGGDALSTINPDDIASISLLKGSLGRCALRCGRRQRRHHDHHEVGLGRAHLGERFEQHDHRDAPLAARIPDLLRFGRQHLQLGCSARRPGEELCRGVFPYGLDDQQLGVDQRRCGEPPGLSYGNVTSEGITPENDYAQHTLNSKVGFDLFGDHVKVDFSAKYVNQHVSNQPAAGWLINPLTGAYLFPRGVTGTTTETTTRSTTRTSTRMSTTG